MKKELMTLVCGVALLGGATGALAGAYGEPAQAEEMPAAAPAAPAPIVEEEPDYAAPGAYLGIGGVYAFEFFGGEGDGDLVGNSSGFKVFGGYRFHPNVAAQVRYERYLGFDTDDNGSAGDLGGEYDGWSLMADVKGYILTGRFQPYVVIGLGYLDMEASQNTRRNNPLAAPNSTQTTPDASQGFVMRYGAGLDTYCTENFSIGPEVAWVQPYGDADDLAFLTVGMNAIYKF